MQIDLSDREADVLRSALDDVLRDLSHEIAATDNASFRHDLRARRELLEEVRAKLDG